MNNYYRSWRTYEKRNKVERYFKMIWELKFELIGLVVMAGVFLLGSTVSY